MQPPPPPPSSRFRARAESLLLLFVAELQDFAPDLMFTSQPQECLLLTPIRDTTIEAPSEVALSLTSTDRAFSQEANSTALLVIVDDDSEHACMVTPVHACMVTPVHVLVCACKVTPVHVC
jgi:hypothetical protein